MTVTIQSAQGRPLTAANQQSGTSYTLVLADAYRSCEFSNAGVVTVTVPLNSTTAFPIGTRIPLRQTGFGGVKIAPAGGVTINSPLGYLGSLYRYSEAVLEKTATDTWQLAGSIRSAASNLFTKTEQLDNAYWTAAAVTVTANNTTAPDGNATADKLLETAATTNHNIGLTSALAKSAAATRYTMSFYVKGISRRWVSPEVWNTGFTDAVRPIFDITTGLCRYKPYSGGDGNFLFESGYVEDAPNGFVRCCFKFSTDTDTGIYAYISILDDTQTKSYLGDITKGIYLWGMQLVNADDAGIYQVVA